MKIRKLNEEMNTILNEISLETKERVLSKRKEQARFANDKLNKSLELMSKSDVGVPDEIEVDFVRCSAQSEEDDYENGCDPSRFNSWDGAKPTCTFNIKSPDFIEDLVNEMGEACYLYGLEPDDGLRCEIDTDGEIRLSFQVMTDEDGEIVRDKSIFDSWKKREIRLWLTDGFCHVELSDEDKPYFIEALKRSGKFEVEEW